MKDKNSSKNEIGKIDTVKHLKIPITQMLLILKEARDKGFEFDDRTVVNFIFQDSKYIGYEFE
mgnify:CR=1 FL=1